MFVIIERIFVYFIYEIMKIGNSIDSSNDFSFFFNLLKKKKKIVRYLIN